MATWIISDWPNWLLWGEKFWFWKGFNIERVSMLQVFNGGASATSRLLFWTFAVIKKYWVPLLCKYFSSALDFFCYHKFWLHGIESYNKQCGKRCTTLLIWTTYHMLFLKSLKDVFTSDGKFRTVSKPNRTLTFNICKPAVFKHLLMSLGSVAGFLHYKGLIKEAKF